MFKRTKIWLAFEDEHGGQNKAKPHNLADVEHFARETELSIISEPEWIEELFRIQERFEEGSLLALHEAIEACDEAQIGLPEWAQSALKRLVVSTILNKPFERKERGRANSTTAKMREELKRHIRKNAVEGVRRYQALEPCLFAFVFLPMGLKILHEGKPLPNLGHTTSEAIQHASVALRGTFAQASEETIRKAYFSSEADGWGPWVFSRKASLEAVGAHDGDTLILPEGYCPSMPDTDDDTYLPMDIQTRFEATIMLDSISAAYVQEVKEFDDIDEFFETQRRKNRSAYC